MSPIASLPFIDLQRPEIGGKGVDGLNVRTPEGEERRFSDKFGNGPRLFYRCPAF